VKLVLVTNITFGVGAALIGQANSVMEWLILVSLAVTAVGVLRVKVLLPSVHFTRKLVRGVDILLEMPVWRRDVDTRLDALERARERDHLRRVDVTVHQD
jgi:hypothetical protein